MSRRERLGQRQRPYSRTATGLRQRTTPKAKHDIQGLKHAHDPNLIKLEQGEKILLVAHHHWMDLVRRWSIWMLAFIIVMGIALARLPAFDLLNQGLLVVAFILIGIMAFHYIDWRQDHLIVTTKRVVQIREVPLISNRQDELVMEAIENVNIRTESFISRWLNYGDVTVQTASRARNIHTHTISDPEGVQKLIMSRVSPLKKTMAEDRARKIIRSRVIGNIQEPPPVAPVHLLPDSFFGQGFTFLFPPNPRKDGDQIIWHKHWTWAVGQLSEPALLILIIVVGRFVLLSSGFEFGLLGNLIYFIALIGVVGWMVYRWWDWLDDEYIITMNEVVDIERHPLGEESRKQASLGALLNVSSNQENIVARAFNYGDVFLTTAGGAGEFSFLHVPSPDEIQAVVFDYIEAYKRRQNENERYAVLDILRHYHAIHTDPNQNGGQPQP